MSYEPRMIAPFGSGLNRYYKPWLIGEDAFPNLTDAYPYRGSIRKREGFDLLGVIKEQQTVTVTNITTGTTTSVTTSGPHGLVSGNYVIITGVTGTVATAINGITFRIVVTAANTFTLQVVGSVAGVTQFVNLDTTGLVYTAGGVLFWLPPLQGLRTFIIFAVALQGLEQLIAFTAKRAYLFNNSTGVFDNISFNAASAPIVWNGGNDDFFYSSNYAGSLWATNNNTTNHIRYWNGSAPNGWSDFIPTVSGTTQMNASLLILPYKGVLVALNTTEGSQNFAQRARWSQLGTPYTSNVVATAIQNITPSVSPTIIQSNAHGLTTGQTVGFLNILGSVGNLLNFNQYVATVIDANNFSIAVDTSGLAYTSGGTVQGPGSVNSPPAPYTIDIFAWRDDIPGRGGFVDADTNDKIVGAEIVKDTLIVFFNRSTWRLRYTGNQILPFIWERLNTQYGAESTFSTVAFDEAALAFSRYGWIGSDTNDVIRIDENIPDSSFQMEVDNNLTGLKRVHAIRDFYRQFAYWTYLANDSVVPNQIYAYNYLDKSWAIFQPQGLIDDPSIRVFGHYRTLSDVRWQDMNDPEDKWEKQNNSWNFGSQGQGFPYVVGGDQNGNVYIMFDFFDGSSTDGTQTLNATNFNYVVQTKRFNPYIEQGHKCRLAYVDIYCTSDVGGEITVQLFTDDKTNTPMITRTVPLYNRGPIPVVSITPGATTTVVTLTNHNLTTNQYVVISSAMGTIGDVLNNISFPVTVTNSTTFTIALNSVGFTYTTGAYCNSEVLSEGDSKYTRVYLGAIARVHQIVFTLSAQQLSDPVKGAAQFEMQGMVLWTRQEGRIRG